MHRKAQGVKMEFIMKKMMSLNPLKAINRFA